MLKRVQKRNIQTNYAKSEHALTLEHSRTLADASDSVLRTIYGHFVYTHKLIIYLQHSLAGNTTCPKYYTTLGRRIKLAVYAFWICISLSHWTKRCAYSIKHLSDVTHIKTICINCFQFSLVIRRIVLKIYMHKLHAFVISISFIGVAS